MSWQPWGRETPTVNRILCVVLAMVVTVTSSADAQDVWTAQSVSSRVRERAPLLVSARASAREAHARVEGVGLHPNPSVDWERQESFAPDAQAQDLVRVTIPFDLSGRRDAARLLAELSAEDSDVAASGVGLSLWARALTIFYDALAMERRVALLHDAQGVLDEAARVLSSRQAVGEASGYERARLTLEAELGRSRLTRAALDRRVALDQLAALLGEAEARPMVGDFDVPPPPPLDELMARAAGDHPELRSLAGRLSTARTARSAADTAWFPSFSVQAGYNRQEGLQVGHGYTVGLRVDIPLFDRGQGEQAQAAVAVASLEDYGDALRAAVRSEVRAARARLEGVISERARFDATTSEATELLLRAANTGFQGGERSLVELLDARRAALEVAERRLDLDLEARLADIELRRVTGVL